MGVGNNQRIQLESRWELCKMGNSEKYLIIIDPDLTQLTALTCT